jgi:hypothetical protein|tara:strand:+ start:1577 stop:2104 length:528 start_codon:yes stop_codon:yes gene_type:complete
MAFWSDGNISPKLSFKWVLTLGSDEYAFKEYTISSFQKPSFTVGLTEYIAINDVGYKPGILSWNPVEIVLLDPEETYTNNSYLLYKLLRKTGHVRKSPGDNRPQSAIIKKDTSDALGGLITFNQLDSNGQTIESWYLHRPFITAASFGTANYSSEELMTIGMTIQYDEAEYRLGT